MLPIILSFNPFLESASDKSWVAGSNRAHGHDHVAHSSNSLDMKVPAGGLIEEVNARRLEPFILPPCHLKLMLYPAELILWAQEHRNDIMTVERKIQAMLSSANSFSVALKPMPFAGRCAMHALAKFYQLNSYEYDYEPRRYVSVVKTVESRLPSKIYHEDLYDLS